jgi:alpha-glucosidase
VTERSVPDAGADWWRGAVVYQVYPRSFADANGDGTGDVRGILDRLPYLADLGIDAVWISPWYPSPLADGGYDVSDYRDIHPDFGTLEQADELITRAHELGLRIIIDLVPNHSSDRHPWFVAALAAEQGSAERALYLFRDGRGPDGDLPPNNWPAMFGGGAWERTIDPDGTPGQWYLHLFAPEQPDWNWDNPAVADEFDAILRFWFDRGVDGFRIDVANSMAKAPGLPDVDVDPETGEPLVNVMTGTPYMNQPHVHDILRRWRTVADAYADSEQGPRVFVSEAWVTPADELARYVRPDELHTTFNFDALMAEWTPASQRHVIDLTLAATGAVGAPATWVLANHDTTRVVTRYGRPITGLRFGASGVDAESFAGIGQVPDGETDVELGRRRARAAVLLELALPGSAYVYQGDELGLEEVEDLPDEVLQDPTWIRSGHTVRGRDGCRVPLPWSGDAPPFGFGSVEQPPWLPQPEHWAKVTVAAQEGDRTSMLWLYRTALAERRRHPALGDGSLTWDAGEPAEVLAFTREPGFRCVVNFGAEPYPLPADARVLVASQALIDRVLGQDQAVWLEV